MITGCSSPEQQKAQREKLLTKFAGTVIEHLLDRNPETMQRSLDTLAHDELTPPLADKLQSQKWLPESDLYVLKMKQDFEAKHESNKIVLDTVQALDPITQPDVRFHVIGKDVSETNGVTSKQTPFDYIASIHLTDDMDGMARVTDLTSSTAKAAPAPAEATADSHSKKRRRHR
jgi:hypothetical protein